MNTPRPAAIESFIRIAGRLTAIMEQEIEFLRRMEITEIAALQEEQNVLVIAYQDGIRQFEADPETLNALEPALKPEPEPIATRRDHGRKHLRQAPPPARHAQ